MIEDIPSGTYAIAGFSDDGKIPIKIDTTILWVFEGTFGLFKLEN